MLLGTTYFSLRTWVLAGAMGVLSACGGGTDATSTASAPGQAASESTTLQLSMDAPAPADEPAATLQAATWLSQAPNGGHLPGQSPANWSPNTTHLTDTADNTNTAEKTAAEPDPAAPANDRSSSDGQVFVASTTTTGNGSATSPIGGATATVAAPVAGCTPVTMGSAYSATTPAANGLHCFQFVVSTLTKVDAQVLLPSGIAGQTYLFYVDPATGQLTTLLDSDASAGSTRMLAQTVGQNVRLALVVQPTTGTGGQNYSFGVFARPGHDSFEANDKPNTARQVAMGTQISANIDVPGIDADYYFFPLASGQTSAQVRVTFTSSQTAGVRIAQRTGPNSYTVGPERIFAANESGVTVPLAFSGLPNNTPTTTTPHGLLVRVNGVNASAPAKQTYTVRVANTNGTVGLALQNTESLSFRFPWHFWQSRATVSATAYVNSANGAVLANEPVQFRVYPNLSTDPNNFIEFNTFSGSNGTAFANITIPGCSGVREETYQSISTFSQVVSTNPYTTRWVKDTWRGTAVEGLVTVELPASGDKANNFRYQLFTHICSETYLGRRAPF